MKYSSYFETIIVIILVSAALGRIFNSDIRQQEISENPFLNEVSSYAIIVFELLSIYFIFYSNKMYKNMYLFTYILLVLPLSIFYILKNTNLIKDLKSLFIYTPNIKSIFIHILILLIMIYIIIK